MIGSGLQQLAETSGAQAAADGCSIMKAAASSTRTEKLTDRSETGAVVAILGDHETSTGRTRMRLGMRTG